MYEEIACEKREFFCANESFRAKKSLIPNEISSLDCKLMNKNPTSSYFVPHKKLAIKIYAKINFKCGRYFIVNRSTLLSVA
jgi:hypothetical protein